MSSDRGHQTQWTAQFAVASELCKRGYEVAFTSGHTTPVADMMAVSPIKKEMFLVDVKGLYRKNPWLIKRKTARGNLFYILAFVPIGDNNRYFILSQRSATDLIVAELQRLSRADDYPITGFSFKLGELHENAWNALPA
jgi:hypothetical protein